MPSNTWSMQDAKNKFCKLANDAYAGTPQFVTKRGAPMVAVVNADYLKDLQKNSQPSFVNFLLSMPKDDQEFERLEIKPREIEF